MAKTYFQSNWIDKYSWIKEDVGNKNSAFCKLCLKSFSLSNMGITAILSHMKGKKHTTITNAQKESYNVNDMLTAPNDVNANQSTVKNNCTVSTKKQNISTFLERDNVTRAEIIWALSCIENHLSMSAGGRCVEIMKYMYPDSEIASNIQLQRAKLTYVIIYGLGKYFSESLISEVLDSDFFSISFDESLNKISQKEQMDIIVRFWCKSSNKVISRYLTSCFLGHTTAIDLLEALKSALKNFDLNKMIHLSMDGPYVNIKVLKTLQMELANMPNINTVMLDLGTCGIHTLHNSFKVAMQTSKWEIIEFLRAIYNNFKNVPARRSDYTKCSGSYKFPLKFCPVRWLQNIQVAERAEEILPNLLKYVNFVKNTPREPTSLSYKIMINCLNDKLLKPKLAFFKSLANDVEPFLRNYQSDAPMAPFLYTDLKTIMETVMQKFIKKEIFESTSITSIDVTDKNNIRLSKYIDLGYTTRQALRNTEQINDKDMLKFRLDCSLIFQKFCSKLLDKSPLKYPIVRSITFCDPNIIASNFKISLRRLKNTLEIFVDNNLISGCAADRVEREFIKLFNNSQFIERCKNYLKTDRLDEFWTNLPSMCNLSVETMRFLKTIFILFHGNAAVERGFSINKECISENMKEDSLIGQRHVWSAINAAGGTKEVNISKTMIHAVRNARSYYHEALEQAKKEDQEKQRFAENQKRANEQLKELKEKRRRLLESAMKETEAIDEEMSKLQK
ncbi:unnamed protein product [Macrosiphum euphorbiae]|uniref:Transposase n=1 Tax=Macrosiphum euphorbiae TaxID=13131 RepID=A0AAV0WA00_9HEMI|nr:unnamed protein product [Macrosiphum euphorbiae]